MNFFFCIVKKCVPYKRVTLCHFVTFTWWQNVWYALFLCGTTQFLVTISPPKRSAPLQSSQLYIPRRTTTPEQENPVVKRGEDTRISSPLSQWIKLFSSFSPHWVVSTDPTFICSLFYVLVHVLLTWSFSILKSFRLDQIGSGWRGVLLCCSFDHRFGFEHQSAVLEGHQSHTFSFSSSRSVYRNLNFVWDYMCG